MLCIRERERERERLDHSGVFEYSACSKPLWFYANDRFSPLYFYIFCVFFFVFLFFLWFVDTSSSYIVTISSICISFVICQRRKSIRKKIIIDNDTIRYTMRYKIEQISNWNWRRKRIRKMLSVTCARTPHRKQTL